MIGPMSDLMPDLEPLVCIGCGRHDVDPTSDEADGWVLVENSVFDGDEHDDRQWKCPDCASASDEFFGDPDRRVADALGLRDDE
jgi:hypothetical protein